MANERQDYIQQRVPQIVKQMIATFEKPIPGLKSRSDYIEDQLSTLSGPLYDNYLFRDLIKKIGNDAYYHTNDDAAA